MSLIDVSRRAVLASRNLSLCQACFQCRLAQDAAVMSKAPRPWRRHIQSPQAGMQFRQYAAQRLKLDSARMRKDADDAFRRGVYLTAQKQKTLLISANLANSIYSDFLHHKDRISPKENVKQLVEKYNVDLEALTVLALITYQVPDLSDPNKRAALPPSPHKPTACQILTGSALNSEPTAIIHILTAWHTSATSSDKPARDFSSYFSRKDINTFRTILDTLCSDAKNIPLGPDALTLKALFLQSENRLQEARELLTQAVSLSHLKYTPGARHPTQWPLATPWNALGFILKASNDAADQASAKQYFELGATKADDPLSCYEYAQYFLQTQKEWLLYMSKAAATGHPDAAVQLAGFYERLSEGGAEVQEEGLKKCLTWLLGWNKDAVGRLAGEWRTVVEGYKEGKGQGSDQMSRFGVKKTA